MKSIRLVSMLAGIAVTAAAGCSPPPTDSTAQASPDSSTAAAAPPPAASMAGNTYGPPAPPPENVPTPNSVENSKVPDTTTIDGKTVKLQSTKSGLKYYDIKVGNGANPQVGQTVSVQYTGTLLDGTKFDSSYDHGGTPIDFPIGTGHVIKGWDEGVPTMKIGGKRRLVVPSDLAYGANPPTPGIPPNATLIFDIDLVAVK